MKRLILSIICVLTLTSMLTACDRLTVTQEDTYVSDSWQSDAVGAMKYIKGVSTCDTVEFEQVIIDTPNHIGPTEPRYVGVIHLSEDEARDFMEKYEWTECDYPGTAFATIAIEDPDSSTWYSSEDFEKDIFTMVNVVSAVFNGKVIVFEIQTR